MLLTKFILASKEDVFNAFINPKQLEKWCYPEGFDLRVPVFEPRVGGLYHYIHTSVNGEYNCTGHITEIRPNEKLVSVDDKIIGPLGNVLFENLTAKISFQTRDNGTEVNVIQEGFLDEKSAKECESGWVDCLKHLDSFLTKTISQQRSSQRAKESGESASL